MDINNFCVKVRGNNTSMPHHSNDLITFVLLCRAYDIPCGDWRGGFQYYGVISKPHSISSDISTISIGNSVGSMKPWTKVIDILEFSKVLRDHFKKVKDLTNFSVDLYPEGLTRSEGTVNVRKFIKLCDKHKITFVNWTGGSRYYGVKLNEAYCHLSSWGMAFKSLHEFQEFLKANEPLPKTQEIQDKIQEVQKMKSIPLLQTKSW